MLPALVLTLALASHDDEVDYQRDVRPILADRCFTCHGPDAHERKARLRLDRREDALPVLAPGDARASELLARVGHADPAERMPPAASHRRALAAHEIDVLRCWIDAGAVYSEHWAFEAPRRPALPEVQRAQWVQNPVDRFVLAQLEAAGVEPAPEADARTLARRLAFDLVGLPLAPERVAEFVEAARTDARAYGELVDELCASPHHGERMAVYWLDLVRYGDSSGYHSDRPVPAWPYRDWVIRAFNANMPFDRFVRAQVAGDLLSDATLDDRVAAVFHRLCKTTDEGGAQPGEYVVKYAADRVRTTAGAFLGLTLGCAECHDHKFDPLPQRDFYRFAAFFADIEEVGVYEHGGWREWQPLLEVPAAGGDTAACLATVSTTPRVVRVLARGDWLDASGEEVLPGTPGCLPPLPAREGRATRLDLADWIVADANPLTARVLVNRLWYLCFGEGLASVLDDLGVQGAYPSHPALLDWLAVELVESGWDVRHVLRLLVTSATYRQSARTRPELALRDPQNRLFARQNRWRLDAEFVRDTALAAAGLLDRRIGGPSVKPYQPARYWQHLNFPTRSWEASAGSDQHRRGLYTHWQRTFLHPSLLAFDAPSREESTARRPRSNTPLAALALLDDPSFVEAARVLAQAAAARAHDDRARLAWLFQRALQRPPGEAETVTLEGLLADQRAHFGGRAAEARALCAVGVAPGAAGLDAPELAAWIQVARAVLNLHETITRP
jgi:hypothetical protein